MMEVLQSHPDSPMTAYLYDATFPQYLQYDILVDSAILSAEEWIGEIDSVLSEDKADATSATICADLLKARVYQCRWMSVPDWTDKALAILDRILSRQDAKEFHPLALFAKGTMLYGHPVLRESHPTSRTLEDISRIEALAPSLKYVSSAMRHELKFYFAESGAEMRLAALSSLEELLDEPLETIPFLEDPTLLYFAVNRISWLFGDISGNEKIDLLKRLLLKMNDENDPRWRPYCYRQYVNREIGLTYYKMQDFANAGIYLEKAKEYGEDGVVDTVLRLIEETDSSPR
jgi:hypothetical protein